ncbi:thiamine diphosphate-binding protein [Dactylonectria estremocensis]|uniref:Thiamine diphosphate-binding protein n=1 Tax=Dactylonectria estremocensis TaxID=1079267 RepID=A0A9P9JFG5_9HYPO|nr:thiamine diphosphate-binding protein [Dactylonectria estremocensis]
MSCGLPAGIGAKIARPDCLVVDIDGDTSFSMTLAKYATMAEHKIAVEELLFNNDELGMVSDLHSLYYAGGFSHNCVVNLDFIRFSEAFGVAAARLVVLKKIEKRLNWLSYHDGPALLEVVSVKDVPMWPVVPAGSRSPESNQNV